MIIGKRSCEDGKSARGDGESEEWAASYDVEAEKTALWRDRKGSSQMYTLGQYESRAADGTLDPHASAPGHTHRR